MSEQLSSAMLGGILGTVLALGVVALMDVGGPLAALLGGALAAIGSLVGLCWSEAA